MFVGLVEDVRVVSQQLGFVAGCVLQRDRQAEQHTAQVLQLLRRLGRDTHGGEMVGWDRR